MSLKHCFIPLALLCTSLSAQTKLINPADPLIVTDLRVLAEEVVVMPTTGSNPRARLAILREAPDESGRLFVVDMRGYIQLLKDGEVSTFMDFRKEIGSRFKESGSKGCGLAAMAFHPDFASNGKFYTAHSEDPGSAHADFSPPVATNYSQQVLWMEWTVDDPAADTFSGQGRELLRVDSTGNAHAAQELAFNPTAEPGDADYGMLYVTLGECESMIRGSPINTGRKDSLYGSVLRIDPAGNNSANGQYGIPSDNPFVNDPEARPEIWALGFRNPHRISWDAANGNMFLGDVGEMNIEEINLVEPGKHYGWPDREGTWLFDRHSKGNGVNVFPLPDNDSGYTYPIAQFDHDTIPDHVWTGVVGGFTYRGETVRELYGKYLFGDITSGVLMYIHADDVEQGRQLPIYTFGLKKENGVNTTVLGLVRDRASSGRTDLRFGQDLQGEIYIMTKQAATVHRMATLLPPPAENPFPGTPGQRETWMGAIDDSSFPWLEHNSLGWLYMLSGNADGGWYSSESSSSWFWTGEPHYPWIYLSR